MRINKEESFVIRAAGHTDIGCVRIRNEDAYFLDIPHGILIVADGLGGHSGGDKAANMATTLLPGIIARRIKESTTPRSSGDQINAKILAQSLDELSSRIRKAGNSQLEYTGMGTTVVATLLTARHAHIAYMGDSRAYLFRENRMIQITEDHSIVALLVRHGEITQQEAEFHPAKGRLSRFAGMDSEGSAATITIELQAGDRLLLCTDGLWGMLPEAKINDILGGGHDSTETCRSLLENGIIAGGQDNLTAIVADILDDDIHVGSSPDAPL